MYYRCEVTAYQPTQTRLVFALVPRSTSFEDHNVYEGAAKDDWAVITAKENTVDDKAVLVKADVPTGKITSVKKESGNVTEVRVDGT